ncbi:MAG TPA: response regulator [Candidatus Limnocylindria bacterium]|nr:response regulator [Candidatus Limnocylindria bacterium]
MPREGAPFILVIEDDPTIADLLSEIARDAGMHAQVVADPNEVGDGVSPDLIVTDLVAEYAERPEHGLEYLRQLRERFATVPLLLVTARTWPRAALQLPVEAVISKPFDVDLLSTQMVSLTRHAAPLK